MQYRIRHLTLMACVCLFHGCASLENRFIFHPIPSTPEPTLLHALVQDVSLKSKSGVKIHARFCRNPLGKRAILYCPGNAGNLEHRGFLVHQLCEEMEESVMIFDYPGYGQSAGHPTERGCYEAADAAYDWLVQNGISPEHIIIYGESLGGGVAVNLASRRPHRALVLARTFTSVPDVAQARLPFLPMKRMMVNRFDSLQNIGKCRRPIFVASAEKDEVVPFEHGRQLHQAAKSYAHFYVMKCKGHNDPPPPEFYAELHSFLEKTNTKQHR